MRNRILTQRVLLPSWWSRVAPDGQEYRYLKNEKASAGFDPAARPQLKHSHKTILAKHDAHRAGAKKAGVSMLLQTSAQTESGHGLDQISFSHENALSEMSGMRLRVAGYPSQYCRSRSGCVGLYGDFGFWGGAAECARGSTEDASAGTAYAST